MFHNEISILYIQGENVNVLIRVYPVILRIQGATKVILLLNAI